MRHLLDSNILLRYLTNDHPKLAVRCEALLEKIVKGKEDVLLTPLVIAEVVWVLESQYDYPREKISELVLKLIHTPHIEVPDKDILTGAFALWHRDRFEADFIDVYHAAWIEAKGLKGVYSYDRDFDRLAIPRFEP